MPAKKAAKKTGEVIEIKPLDLQKVTVHIEGDTSLIEHNWSEKAKLMMIEAHKGIKKGKPQEPRNEFEEFLAGAYYITDPKVDPNAREAALNAMRSANIEEFNEACEKGVRFGVPAKSFKQAAICSAYRMGWAKDKMSLRGAFFVEGDEDGLVEIHSDTPVMREDAVRIGKGTAELRYRPEFRNWSADLDITYNRNGAYDLTAILNMLNAGGCVCGIGEWRVERDGNYGMFHIAA